MGRRKWSVKEHKRKGEGGGNGNFFCHFSFHWFSFWRMQKGKKNVNCHKLLLFPGQAKFSHDFLASKLQVALKRSCSTFQKAVISPSPKTMRECNSKSSFFLENGDVAHRAGKKLNRGFWRGHKWPSTCWACNLLHSPREREREKMGTAIKTPSFLGSSYPLDFLWFPRWKWSMSSCVVEASGLLAVVLVVTMAIGSCLVGWEFNGFSMTWSWSSTFCMFQYWIDWTRPHWNRRTWSCGSGSHYLVYCSTSVVHTHTPAAEEEQRKWPINST